MLPEEYDSLGVPLLNPEILLSKRRYSHQCYFTSSSAAYKAAEVNIGKKASAITIRFYNDKIKGN